MARRKPEPITHAMKAYRALNDAFSKHGKVSKELRCEYAITVLEQDGMAPDMAADVVARVWRTEFEIMGAV